MTGRQFHLTTLNGAQAAAPILAEFIGSFALVFVVGTSKLCGYVWAPFCVACVFSALLYALAPVSASLRSEPDSNTAAPVISPGAHLNPALTFVSVCFGQLSLLRAIMYVLMQLGGALLGGLASEAILGTANTAKPAVTMNWTEAGVSEAVYTGFLCFVFLNCWVSCKNHPLNNGNQFYGLAVGFVYVAAGHATGRFSWTHLNPSLSLALELRHGAPLTWRLAYTGFQFLGASGAMLVFWLCRRSEFVEQTERQRLGSRALAEFLGAFFVALTYGLSVLSQSSAVALATGIALMCMCFSVGDISGGHFNPAVTLVVLLAGRAKMRIIDALAYVVVQLGGGLLAGLVVASMYTANRQKDVKLLLGPHDSYTFEQVLTLEFAYTSVLCFAVLAVTTVPNFGQGFGALAIGSVVVGGGLSVGSVSGGFFNPAVALSIGSAKYIVLGKGLVAGFIYAVFQCLGGCFAWSMFMLTHPDETDSNAKMYG